MKILGKTMYDLKGHTDENSLYRYGLRKPNKLTKNIIYESGLNSNKFPLLTLTEGHQGLSYFTPKKLNDTAYTWPVMGRMKHTTEIKKIIGSSTNVGIGHSTFDVIFKDARAIPTYGMYTPDKQHMVRIQAEHGDAEGGKRYTLILQGGDDSATIDPSNFLEGKHWVLAAPTTPESKGKGNRSHSMAPGEMMNQYGFFRFSKEISGNVANQVVEVEFDLKDGGKTNKWMPWEMYQFELDNLQYLEEDLWDQEFNQREDGTYTFYDMDSGEPIVRGAGVIQQIKEGGIYDTYSGKLYLGKLDAISDEITNDDPDNGIMEIVVHTGKGGAKEIHNSIMNDAVGNQFTHALGDAIISGSGGMLNYGAYFNQYRTINGHRFTVMVGNVFDYGLKAEMDKKNGNFMPGTNLPRTSYNMIFLDQSTYSGERNIQATAMQGQERITGVYKGLTPIPPSWEAATAGNMISTRTDMSAYEIKMSRGTNILKAKNCVYLEAVA